MNRVVTVIVAAIAVASTAFAEEGRVADEAVVVGRDRGAHYSRGASQTQNEAVSGAKAPQGTRHHQLKANAVAGKPGRTVMMATRADYFYIYDAVSTLRADRDGDGYHSEFRIRFDADVRVGDALVYARLYLRRVGESEWFLYRETDDFWIYGQSGDDDYYVTTALDAGYATGEYDVLIDLYEAGQSGIVATLGPLESGALIDLPLEEVGLDVPAEIPGYSIGEVITSLIADDDADGFYSRFQIAFDPDADFQSRLVYARVWVRPRGGNWIEDFVSEDWWVNTSGSSDAYVLDVDWLTGYPSSYYDVQIDLHDSASDRLIASAGSERFDLAQLPLEDRSRDQRISVPTPPTGGGSSSREGGGGSFELYSLLGLMGLGALARSRRRAS